MRNKVLMVCSRDIPAAPESGRERTMRFIYDELSKSGDIQVLRINSILEDKSVFKLVGIIFKWTTSAIMGRIIPLQSLLFWDARVQRELFRKLSADTNKSVSVYFDGIRSAIYLPAVRSHYPDLHIVCDFDDLMSRRFINLRLMKQTLSLGYLKNNTPKWIQRHLQAGIVGKAVALYEENALRLEESLIINLANEVVLVSSIDTTALASCHFGMNIHTIPPVMNQLHEFVRPLEIKRFVFIGSDSLLQNRTAIEYLVNLWNKLHPPTELHIFGRQNGSYADTTGVFVHGFVADLSEVYQPGSVLLSPSFVSGGVKTKVLEAFSHGIIVVGNEITFEGVDATVTGLIFTETALMELIQRPESWAKHLEVAGAIAIEQASVSHSAEYLGNRWRNIIWPSDH